MELQKKYKAVRFDHYGGIDVLHIEDVPLPEPGQGQVLVKVRAAGINPGEAAIREGLLAKQWPAHFPSGQGSDFAGVVEKIGPEVKKFTQGDEVIGFTENRASQAEYVLAEADHLIRRPAHVSWEQAGALFVAGTTAYAAVKSVGLKKGDTLVISAAAGGVGSIALQLAVIAGAKVIGLAGSENHAWIISKGAVPVSYGEGMKERIMAAANGKVDAFIDTYGHGYVELAVQLGVSPDRIDTIIDFPAAQKYKVRTAGNAQAATAEVMSELAALMESGRLEIPIDRVFPLVEVQDAFRVLERRHTHGKIVLVP
ncbi:MAG TPA: NADP-dependent oxidoreductase [Puia sp.]|nr:NADP-dependent oxidoreductase [Puia sp.]